LGTKNSFGRQLYSHPASRFSHLLWIIDIQMPQPKLTDEILAAALEGYEAQKTRIDAQIAEIRIMLSGGPAVTAASSEAAQPRRKVSASSRRRMARAQKLRWKKLKQSSEAPQAAAEKPKRHMSAKARKQIAAAQKKRWAAIKKEAARPAAAKKTGRKKAAGAPEPSAASGS
jgi:hypothetical protein